MKARRRSTLTGLVVTVVTSALTAGLVAIGPTAPAAAADGAAPPVVQRPATGVTADALPTTQINGVVWDQAIVGNTVFAGGEFTKARPAGAALGTNETPRSNLLAYDIRTGVLKADFAPVINGRVRTVTTSPDGRRLYVGGAFTMVDGKVRNRIAAFDISTGKLVADFAPVVASDVFAIAVTGNALYLGGWFKSVNGVARQRLAAVNPTTGALLGWAPTADNTIYSLAVTQDGTKVIAGGTFANLNGSSQPGIGWFDSGNAAVLPFAANQVVRNSSNSAGIYSVVVQGDTVFATGFVYGGGNLEGMFTADSTTGAIKTLEDCHGDSYDVSPVGSIVYVVGHPHYCSNVGGFPDTNPRSRWMRSVAFTLDATGTVQHNGQLAYHDLYGQPAPSLINWFPDMAVGSYTGQSQGGWTTEATSEYVVQGGEFPAVNNKPQQGLVRFAVPSLASNTQGPRVSAADSVPRPVPVDDTRTKIFWPTSWDRDDQSLQYELYRVGTTAPIHRTTAISRFWSRPTLSFVDTGLTKGQSYGYYVRVSDPSGNSVTSTTATSTAGEAPVTESAYSRQIVADGATNYWRLDQKPGATTTFDWVSGNDLNTGAGVTNGAPGALLDSTDSSASFAGTDANRTSSIIPQAASDNVTIETWFKTTTTTGGKIIGFGDAATANSDRNDRHVYLTNDGKVVFGVRSAGATRTVKSAAAYNDGQWHQVVASLSPAGVRLMVDGSVVGTLQTVTSGWTYTGYWRLGGDTLTGWPDQPATSNFAGQIDDTAIYAGALSTVKVRDHYFASGRTLDIPAAPGDSYGKAVYAAEPTFYWRLDDSAPSAADTGPTRFDGIYAGGHDRRVASPVTGPNGLGVRFDGLTGTIGSARQVARPTVYSEELWFSTTTKAGGKLIGMGDQQTTSSTSSDRHVYMLPSGQLTFGVNAGGNQIKLTTPKSYSDGRWHHLVASQGPDGMKLYLDGKLVTSNTIRTAESAAGYWRVGGDAGWSGSYFAGSIDEVAVYPRALTAAEVQDHYFASPAAVNVSPSAKFTTSCTVARCDLDAATSSDSDGTVTSYAWDFGDGTTGTGKTVSHDYAKSGGYTVALTVTDNGGATGRSSAEVTVVKPNAAPKAAFTPTTTKLKLAVDGGASTDGDGTIASYAWDFGDGATGTGPTASHTYAADGTYPVRLTVTDDAGATDVITQQVTVRAITVLAADTFTRSGSRWGTADTGGAWTDSGAAQFTTNGTTGVMTVAKGGSQPTASLNGVQAVDVAIESEFALDKVPNGGGGYYYTDARRTADGRYVLTVRVLADSTVRVGLRSVVGSTETTLKEVAVSGLNYVPGTVLHARFELSGSGTTALSGRVWKDGTTAPTTPQVTATDTTAVLQQAGAVGLRSYLSASATNVPVVVVVDNLKATSIDQ